MMTKVEAQLSRKNYVMLNCLRMEMFNFGMDWVMVKEKGKVVELATVEVSYRLVLAEELVEAMVVALGALAKVLD